MKDQKEKESLWSDNNHLTNRCQVITKTVWTVLTVGFLSIEEGEERTLSDCFLWNIGDTSFSAQSKVPCDEDHLSLRSCSSDEKWFVLVLSMSSLIKFFVPLLKRNVSHSLAQSNSTHLSDWRRIFVFRKTVILSKCRHLLIGRICHSKEFFSRLFSVKFVECQRSKWGETKKEPRLIFNLPVSLSFLADHVCLKSLLVEEEMSVFPERWMDHSIHSLQCLSSVYWTIGSFVV